MHTLVSGCRASPGVLDVGFERAKLGEVSLTRLAPVLGFAGSVV